MPASERVLAIAGDWVRKAENDLMNAVHTLKPRLPIRACPS
jgi:hypothetical protein